jgi:hypothetical protein
MWHLGAREIRPMEFSDCAVGSGKRLKPCKIMSKTGFHLLAKEEISAAIFLYLYQHYLYY